MKKDAKYEILSNLAGRFNSYHATQWLKTPHPDLGNKSPAELIKGCESIDDVLRVLLADIEKKKK